MALPRPSVRVIGGLLAALCCALLPAHAGTTRWRLVAEDPAARYFVHTDSVERDADDVLFWLKRRPRSGGYTSKRVRLFCGDFAFRTEAVMDSPDGRSVERDRTISETRPLDGEPLLQKCFTLFCGEKVERRGPGGRLVERGWLYRPAGGGPPRKVGPWEYWYPGGGRRESLRFRRGRKEGRWAVWDREGRLRKEQFFHDGLADGPWRTWYASGRKSAEAGYRRGRLHGRWARWDERGRLVEEKWYEDGRVVDGGAE